MDGVATTRAAQSERLTGILGIDVGASWTRVAFMGSQVVTIRELTPRATDAEVSIRKWIAAVTPSSITEILVGLSSAARIDEQGRVADWPSRPDWLGVNLGAALHGERMVISAHADDGVCAALWEHCVGDGSMRASTACISIGTGVGIGLVKDGRRTDSGDGGSTLSHLPLGRPELRCACGRTGCIQATLCASHLRQARSDHDRLAVVNCVECVWAYLNQHFGIGRITVSGGAAELLKGIVRRHFPHRSSPLELNFSATPNSSALGGALLLAVTGGDLIGVDESWITGFRKATEQQEELVVQSMRS